MCIRDRATTSFDQKFVITDDAADKLLKQLKDDSTVRSSTAGYTAPDSNSREEKESQALEAAKRLFAQSR